jgi:hypothetical protein
LMGRCADPCGGWSTMTPLEPPRAVPRPSGRHPEGRHRRPPLPRRRPAPAAGP